MLFESLVLPMPHLWCDITLIFTYHRDGPSFCGTSSLNHVIHLLIYIFLELSGSQFSLVDKKGNSFNKSGMEGLLWFRHGTVCDDGFDFFAADLICKAMGFESAQHWRHGYFNSTNDRYGITLDDVKCNPSHASIEECQYNIEDNDCDHSEDVILACTKPEQGNNHCYTGPPFLPTNFHLFIVPLGESGVTVADFEIDSNNLLQLKYNGTIYPVCDYFIPGWGPG